MLQIMISYKLGSDRRIDLLINRLLCSHIVCLFSRFTRLFLLLLHELLKTFLIHGTALLLQDLCGDVQRESIGIIKLECIGTGKLLLALGSHSLLHLIQDCNSLIDRLVELLFFFI